MSGDPIEGPVRAAEVVLACTDLAATVAFFTDTLGFRIELVFPADDPRHVVISGHGVRLRLQRDGGGAPGVVRLYCSDRGALAGSATELLAPNGTRIELADADPLPILPPLQPTFSLSRLDGASWVTGRAGMRYRDLIPDRQGGRFIASHIQIPDGGPVPDYVHFHNVRFQMIYCHRGWVRVVYEDQGGPFELHPGDCVLQPPGIRHRVLDSSPGLEVIEISSPAEHETRADHDLVLPTAIARSDRRFRGQAFVRDRAADAIWLPWRIPGFEARDTGIGAATAGLAGAHVVRARGTSAPRAQSHDAELLFRFVLGGSVTVHCDGRDPDRLAVSDAVVVPPAWPHALAEWSADLELLEVSLPAAITRA